MKGSTNSKFHLQRVKRKITEFSACSMKDIYEELNNGALSGLISTKSNSDRRANQSKRKEKILAAKARVIRCKGRRFETITRLL